MEEGVAPFDCVEVAERERVEVVEGSRETNDERVATKKDAVGPSV